MATTQKEINNRIAIELDKHCIQNEYGYLLLDQDKSIRDKYKWFINLHTANWVNLGISVLSTIIGLISKLDWLIYIAAVLFAIFITLIIIRYTHRAEISKLLSDTQRQELTKALEKHSEYVDNLRLWFMDVGADKTADKRTLNDISANFKIASRDGNKTYNVLSSLFGVMQDELHDKARNKAIAKLSPLLMFHIK